MKITVSSGNRITIPKEICNKLDLKQGDQLYLDIVGDKLFFSKSNFNNETDDVKEVPKKIESNRGNNLSRKIVSNLEEGKNFKRKVYSACELVIRTKKVYMNEFCEHCKGELLKQGYKDNHKCPYLYNSLKEEVNIENKIEIKSIEKIDTKKNIIKSTIQDINKNVSTLTKKIDNKINKTIINNEDDNKTIVPIASNHLLICSSCGEYYSKGFYLSEKFHCKKCAKKDFKKYLKNKGEI